MDALIQKDVATFWEFFPKPIVAVYLHAAFPRIGPRGFIFQPSRGEMGQRRGSIVETGNFEWLFIKNILSHVLIEGGKRFEVTDHLL